MQASTWALQLTGAAIDVDEAITLFGAANSDPKIQAFDDKGTPITLLTSAQLDHLNNAAEVDQVAKRLLGIVNGTLFVRDPGRIPLIAGGVRERSDDRKWNHNLIAATGLIIARSRAKAVGVAIVDGEPSPEHMLPPAAVRWSAVAQSDQAVGDVFIYLSGEPDWFNFYKAFELMREDINQRLGGQHRQEQIGWPKKRDLAHFTQSAQVYRHAPPWFGGYTPATAMPLGDATRYIRSLAETWLTWRFP